MKPEFKKMIQSLTKDEKDLLIAWMNSGCYSVKMNHYFSIYSELLKEYRGKICTLVEVGVLDGGSLYAWREYLGEKAEIIGIDLNPNAKRFEEEGFRIFIGDQSDINFWNHFYSEVGSIDVLIDDGGHASHQQILTLICALNKINNKALIIVEDTHSNFFTHLNSFEGKNTFLNYSKDVTDDLTLRQVFNTSRPERFPKNLNIQSINQFKNIKSVSFYNGIVTYRIEPYINEIDSLSMAVGVKKKKEEKNVDEKKLFKDHRNSSNIHGISVDWPNPFEKEERIVRGKYFNDDSKTQNIQKIKKKK